MPETKHTPGPWIITQAGNCDYEGSQRCQINSGSVWIADVLCPDTDEGQANARLIAAAPETARQRDMLLEACKAVMTELTLLKGLAQTRGKMETAAVQGRIDQVKAAIAACAEK